MPDERFSIIDRMVRRIVISISFPVSVRAVDQLVLEYIAKAEGAAFRLILPITPQVRLPAPNKACLRGRLRYLPYGNSISH